MARHDLRKAAKGRPCFYRAPGCDGGGETTVLCHVRRAHIAGKGQKPPDVCGFWACANCHAWFDGRVQARAYMSPNNGVRTVIVEYTRQQLDLMAFDALLRTLAQLDKEELI